MKQAEKDKLLADLATVQTWLLPNRPTALRIDLVQAKLREVQVVCQNIPITPVNEGPTPPPPPDPPDPPVEPPPPTTVTTIYASAADFSSVQGHRGWYYLEEDGTSMTYNASNAIWQGGEAFQGIWQTGQHPGTTHGAMRRWTAQGTGTFVITGNVSDAAPGGTGVRFQVLKNGTAIHTADLADGGTMPALNLTGSAASGDTFDFLVKDMAGNISFDSTNVQVSIALTTADTGGNPTQTTLPFTLNGTAPQEGTLTLNMNKPGNADSCTVAVTGVDLDAAEGRIYFNGSTNSMAIWPTDATKHNVSGTVNLAVPVAWVFNGANTLRFTHDSGDGYTVTAVVPSFTTPPGPPQPPATQTTLPFILNGSILPEDALLTFNVVKPGNANGASLHITGHDLAEPEGQMFINGTAYTTTNVWPTDATRNGIASTLTLNPPHTMFFTGSNTIRFTHDTGDGYTVTAVSVTFTTTPDIPPPSGGTWPNQPSNLPTLSDHSFSSIDGDGWSHVWPSGQIVSDGSAPISPPLVYQDAWVNHSFSDIAQPFFVFSPMITEFYLGARWKPSNPFYGWQNNSGQKIFLVDKTRNHVYCQMWRDTAPGAGSQYHLIVSAPTPGGPFVTFANCHTAQENCSVFHPNMGGNASINLGQWHLLEVYLKVSTTTTSRDGIVRAWLNNQPVIHKTDVNFPEVTGFNQVDWHHVWDAVDPQPVTDYHWCDEIRLAGR